MQSNCMENIHQHHQQISNQQTDQQQQQPQHLLGKNKHREVENESRSGSGNENNKRKKRYFCHTAFQIQELEKTFKDNPHPDDKTRQELSTSIGLEPRQVKSWFQNRRTQVKAQQERAENNVLRVRNERLVTELSQLTEALKTASCAKCGEPAQEKTFDEEGLRIQNMRLKQELEHVSTVIAKYFKNSVPGGK